MKKFEDFQLNESDHKKDSAELEEHFKKKYPNYKICPVLGYDDNEIHTGLLVPPDDYTLNNTLVYYWNDNYEIDDVVVKKYPC
jgi:hypothetical protein